MRLAPELKIQSWLNAERQIRLADLRGKIVVLHAFQMLCPACYQHAIPQAERLHRKFSGSADVVVLGLHTVFEDHEEMTPEALGVYVEKNQLTFPIGIDLPREGKSIPSTMAEYDMQGTPTLILIDREGWQRSQYFGVASDHDLETAIRTLVAEKPADA